MAAVNQHSSISSPLEIRIVGLNTDKTRRTPGSYTLYQVYFELSGAPPPRWRDIFARECRDLNPTPKAGIDGGFLVMHCPLQDIASKHLQALKKAVAAANTAYKQYAREQVAKEEHQSDEWERERKVVEDMARSLRFD